MTNPAQLPVEQGEDGDEARRLVRRQYGRVGDAYVTSVGHATGDDLARMVTLARPQSSDTLLDIATGGGHVARVFSPLVGRVIASDLTPEMLATAERYLTGLGLGNVTYLEADAEALPLADVSVGLVTCRIAPHHFPHPDRFVAEAARVLRPGGRFVLVDSTVPAGPAGDWFNAVEQRRDPSHVRSLPIPEWQRLVEGANFALDAVESFPKRHDYAEWTARSRMTDADRDALARAILAADPSWQAEFAVERDDDRLIAFTDVKTLFVARKPTPT